MERIPALDGLRGVAILLVVVFHTWPNLFPAGGYGVTLFFVLSGFLISGILLRDRDRGTVDLRRFYWNRAVRLLPALFLLIATYLLVFGHWEPVLWTVTYTSNFGQLAGAEMGRLSHTWSLAVEEHFYVLWPVVVVLVRPAALLRVVVGLLAIATTWRVWVTFAGDFSRVNLATDTVAFALLAGCALAVLHHFHRLPVVPQPLTMLAVAGIIGAALLAPTGSRAFLWGAIPVVALSMVAIAGCLRGVWLLEGRVLRWFGLVSYGLYLWHVPFLWSRLHLPSYVLLVGAMAVTWISYRFVEQPFRRRYHRSAREDSSGSPVEVATL